MRLEDHLRRMLPRHLYEEPTPQRIRVLTYLEGDTLKLARTRRREDCSRLEECEEGWIKTRGEAPARCPDVCTAFEAAREGS